MSGEVFQVVATEREPFRFQLPGEKKARELPHLDTLPIGIKQSLAKAAMPMQRAAKAGKQPTERQAEAAGEAMLRLFEVAQPGLTDLVDEQQLAQLLQAWQEHSGITTGES